MNEDDGFALLTLMFSSKVKERLMVQFRYIDLTAIGKLHIIMCYIYKSRLTVVSRAAK